MTRLVDADALSELLVKTYEKAPTEKALLFVALLLKNNEQVPTVIPEEYKPLIDKVVDIIPDLTNAIIEQLPQIINSSIKCSECPYYKDTWGVFPRQHGKWIPITYRPMTEEEVKRVETYFGLPLDEEEKKCFSCPMPEHGQEILISTKWGVSKDICLYDCDEGYSLDERGDWEDVDAWMPLPEPYKEADNDKAN